METKRITKRTVNKNSDRGNRGFTLIELLVVIAIIALLLSILMPSLTKAKEQARRLICQSNVKQMGMANLLYAQDNDDTICPMRRSYSPYTFIQEFLDEYIWMDRAGRLESEGDESVYYCPSAYNLHVRKGQTYWNPLGSSFGYNKYSVPHTIWTGSVLIDPGFEVRLSQLKTPSESMWFGDGYWCGVYWSGQISAYPENLGGSPPELVHSGGKSAMFFFFDGHSEHYREEDMVLNPTSPHKSTFWWPYGVNMGNSYIVKNNYIL